MHRQFNLIYVVTLKVVKDCHTLTLGPKFAGMANFGDIGLSNKSKNGGGGGERGGGGSGSPAAARGGTVVQTTITQEGE